MTKKFNGVKTIYSYIPELSIWFSKMKYKSHLIIMQDEYWYGSGLFNSGIFIFIQCKLFALHIKLKWLTIKL